MYAEALHKAQDQHYAAQAQLAADPWAAFPDARPSGAEAKGDRLGPWTKYGAPASSRNATQVKAPDGSIVEFPAGTPEAAMTKAMQEKFGGPTAPAPNVFDQFDQLAVPAGFKLVGQAPAATEPRHSTSTDVGLSFASGVPRGVVETAMTPITLNRAGESLGGWLYDKAEGPVRSMLGTESAMPGPEHDQFKDFLISPITGAVNYALRKLSGSENVDVRSGVYAT
ncbi:hypothetical protein ABID26_007203 [Mesorhizobium shonense]|uniref:Uncharacterized protein n=1 Tax=Mesorhizobium shonense TaxID=1209948 RepID=A0ABV2I4D5_9HYPH